MSCDRLFREFANALPIHQDWLPMNADSLARRPGKKPQQ